jgi:hypothetical protein
MRVTTSLAGLERMLQVCQEYGLALRQGPPGSNVPRAGEPVAGVPCDALLSAVHARVGTFGLSDGFFLLRSEAGDGLAGVNEEWRQERPEPFRDLLVFAKEQALDYYFATVPALAEERGLQPVVWIDAYDELYALPIASSIDRFFDTYSRSLERQMALIREEAEANARLEAELGPPEPGSLRALAQENTPHINFPWEVPDVIARDEPLVKLLQAGRFDFLMESCPDALAWVAKVLDASTPP